MKKKRIKAVIYDFDNTIIHMPTKIKIFNNSKGDYLSLSTEKFAKYKHLIGKDGIFKDCHFDSKSFEEFSSHQGVNSFLIKDIVKTLNSGSSEWRAFYFNNFIKMLQTRNDAQNVYILSARSHSSDEFLDGLRILKKFLNKKYNIDIFLPLKEHLFFVGNNPNIAEAKSEIIERIIMKESKEKTTDIEFADDDQDNIEKAKKLLMRIKNDFSSISFTVSHVLTNSVKKIKIK